MGLIKCPDCEKEVSTRAISCPTCGCPLGTYRSEDSVSKGENAFEKAYLSWGGMGLLDLIPGIRSFPNLLK